MYSAPTMESVAKVYTSPSFTGSEHAVDGGSCGCQGSY